MEWRDIDVDERERMELTELLHWTLTESNIQRAAIDVLDRTLTKEELENMTDEVCNTIDNLDFGEIIRTVITEYLT